ncbi:hypothetical protein STENM327S_07719 [Streptomyces tendae]
MAPVPSTLLWLSVAAALTQALTTRIHLRDNRTSSASDRQREIPNRMVLLGLTVSVFAAVWAVLASLTLERGDFGGLSFSTVREELDTTFVRVILFVFDVASGFVLWALAAAVLGALIGSLIVGRLDATQVFVHAATFTTTAAAGVLIVATGMHLDYRFRVSWLLIALNTFCGFMAALSIREGPPGGDYNPSPARQIRQRPGLGRILTVLGWTLRAVAGSALLVAGPLYSDLEAEETVLSWGPPLAAFALVCLPYPVLATGGALLHRGRRHRHRIIADLASLSGERYLLHLRPFAVDAAMALPPEEAPGWYTRSPFEISGSLEQFLTRQFRGLGRVIAIGQPGELLPPLGAERGYLPVDNWKDTVSNLIRGARAVFLTAAPGPGTVWEFTEALRTTTPDRILLLVYDEDLYGAFRDAVTQACAEDMSAGSTPAAVRMPLPRAPWDLPAAAPQTKGVRWDFPLKGVLSFDPEGRPRFTHFLPTIPRWRTVWTLRRLARRDLGPVLDAVSRLPEHPAPPPPDTM